jgi:hypothetical protein
MTTQPTQGSDHSPSDSKIMTRTGIRDVHVKRVPEAIWLRARQNALVSGLAFKDYLIRVLEQCEPFPPRQ